MLPVVNPMLTYGLLSAEIILFVLFGFAALSMYFSRPNERRKMFYYDVTLIFLWLLMASCLTIQTFFDPQFRDWGTTVKIIFWQMEMFVWLFFGANALRMRLYPYEPSYKAPYKPHKIAGPFSLRY